MTSRAVPPTRPTPVADVDGAKRTYELDRAHVFHSWSAQATLNPLVVAGAQGSWVWDGDEREVVAIGSRCWDRGARTADRCAMTNSFNAEESRRHVV